MEKLPAKFECEINKVESDLGAKYVALASTEDLRKFIPDIDTEKNYDVVPVAFQGFNVNIFNRNRDGIDSEGTLSCYKTFVGKFLDLEHKRDKIVGYITSATLTDLDNNEISEEEASKLDTKYNVVLGGVIWKLVNKDIAEKTEESQDPNSPYFGKIFASFELGFDDFDIIGIKGKSNQIKDGVILDKETYAEHLICYKGSGFKDGYNLYRKVKGNLLGLGAALTTTPAAYVEPVVAPVEDSEEDDTEEQDDENEVDDDSTEVTDELEAKEASKKLNKPFRTPSGPKKFSVYVKNDKGNIVKVNFGDPNMEIKRDNPERRKNFRARHGCDNPGPKWKAKYWSCKFWSKKPVSSLTSEELEEMGEMIDTEPKFDFNDLKKMSFQDILNELNKKSVIATKEKSNMPTKITKLDELTDEAMKEISASFVRDFIHEKMKEAADKYDADLKIKTDAVEAEKLARETILAEHEALKVKTAELEATLNKINSENAAREKQEKLNSRMSEIEATYELNEQELAIITKKVSALSSDEEYTAYASELAVLLKEKNKEFRKSIEAKVSVEKKELAATQNPETKEKSEVSLGSAVSDAIENAEVTTPAIPNTTDKQLSIKEKMLNAFGGKDNFSIKI